MQNAQGRRLYCGRALDHARQGAERPQRVRQAFRSNHQRRQALAGRRMRGIQNAARSAKRLALTGGRANQRIISVLRDPANILKRLVQRLGAIGQQELVLHVRRSNQTNPAHRLHCHHLGLGAGARELCSRQQQRCPIRGGATSSPQHVFKARGIRRRQVLLHAQGGAS